MTPTGPEQVALPFVLMRGGTSKAVFLRGADLPDATAPRDEAILTLFGSPDPRQIDGLGGADLLTSKLAIIDGPTRPDADLDYTFAQVSITEPVVDYDINCGNISAAVGAYAVDEGLVAASGDMATVRIHNTNTGRILVAEVPVVEGYAAVAGDALVDGVPGTGAPIALDYSQTGGGVTGSLLPTGNVSDVVDAGGHPVEVSIVDLANLCVFMSADAVGMAGTEGPNDLTPDQFAVVAAVKRATSDLLGMSDDGLIPVPTVVSPPAPYVSYATEDKIDADAVDLVARVIGGRPPVLHKAYPGTTGACTAVAAMLTGSVVHAVARPPQGGSFIIGHTSGAMPTRVAVTSEDGDWLIHRAAYIRTARRLAEGRALLPRRVAAP